MRDLGEIAAEAQVVAQARQALFQDNALPIQQAVSRLVEALNAGCGVHTLGDGRCAPLAGYVAQLLFEGPSTRALPARLLEGPPDPQGLARAVEAHVAPGDVLLALALEDTPRLHQALHRAHERGIRAIAIATEEAHATLPCDPGIRVSLRGDHAVEGFLAVCHALWELVRGGLIQEAAPDATQPPAERPDRRRSTRIRLRDAFVRWQTDGFPSAGEYCEPHLLEDLSLTGLRFRGSQTQGLSVGDEIYACLDLPLFSEPVRLRAQVRRLVKLKEEGGVTWAAGAKVIEWHGDARQRVRQVVENDSLRFARRRG